MTKLAEGLINIFLVDYKKYIPNNLQSRFKLDLAFVVSEAVEEQKANRSRIKLTKKDVIGI